MIDSPFVPFAPASIAPYLNKRAGERHVADVIQTPQQADLSAILQAAKANGVTTVIVGIPEDIGPRGNCGQGGANKGWPALLEVLLNQQANAFFDWHNCLLLGHVLVEDLQGQSHNAELETLRSLCDQLDNRVVKVLQPIFEHGFQIIIIGGGHNNAYPIIKALHLATQQQVACVNLDPHADFRAMEGRHSGNPFRYAFQEGALGEYHVFGLHEQKNNSDTLEGLADAGFSFTSYQNLFMRNRVDFHQRLNELLTAQNKTQLPSGVELDIDGIKYAAASAFSVAGFSLEQATQYVTTMAQNRHNRYLHLCESAPQVGSENEAGQMLTQLIYAYLTATNINP